MKKYVNGQYIDLTADEISAIRADQAQERRRPRTYEEGISALAGGAVRGKDCAAVFNVIDELMDTLRITAPRVCSGVMRKISAL